MKQARYAKRLYRKIPGEIKKQIIDINSNEVFVPYSFEEWGLKGSLKKKIEIFNLMVEALGYRRKFDNRISIGWINLSRISESSIFMFDSEEEYKKFFRIKRKENCNLPDDFYLEEIMEDEVSNKWVVDIPCGFLKQYYIGILEDCKEEYLILE